MAAVNVTFPGNLAQVKTAADLRSVPSTLLPLGALFLVNGLEGLFEYDPGSLAADDGKDVLRPVDKTPGQAGRWIRNVDGLATGPEGPTGPANSTYTSLAALKAAPQSNRSYILADGANSPVTYAYVAGDFTGRADDVNVVKLDAVPLTTGALVRQAADAIAFKAPKPKTLTRSTANRLAETPSTGDYDTRYAPLGFDNGPGIQAAIDDYAGYASNVGQTVYMPTGLFRTDTPINPSDNASLIGQGPRSTIFYREQDRTDKAAIYQPGIQRGFQRIEGIGFRGYAIGEHIAGAVDGFRRRALHYLLCGVGMQCDGALQTSVLEDIDFAGGNIGIWAKDYVNNRVTVRDCDFKNMAGPSLLMGGAEDFAVEGGRFEAGGVQGGYTLDVSKVRSLHFDKGYMESTHENALRMTNSENGVVSFSNFHFTGTGAQAGGGLGYKWVTDGSGRIVFHNCDATYPMYVPYNALLEGNNPGLIPRMFSGRLPRKRISPAGPVANLVGFRRFNTSNTPTNSTALRATLWLTYEFGSAGGGISGVASSEYTIHLQAQGSGNIQAVIKKNDQNSHIFGSGIVIEVLAGTDAETAIIIVRMNDLDFAGMAYANYTMEMIWQQTSSMDNGLFSVGDGY